MHEKIYSHDFKLSLNETMNDHDFVYDKHMVNLYRYERLISLNYAWFYEINVYNLIMLLNESIINAYFMGFCFALRGYWDLGAHVSKCEV